NCSLHVAAARSDARAVMDEFSNFTRPPPGGSGLRDKTDGSGSFTQVRLRCAAPCQSRSRATWQPSRYPHPSQVLSHLAFGRAVDLRSAELDALSNGAH